MSVDASLEEDVDYVFNKLEEELECQRRMEILRSRLGLK